MGRKRVLCGYGVDVDAVSGHLNTIDGTRANTANISRGIFGAQIGTRRLLELFKRKNDIKCSWYVPAHTVETFPEQIAAIRDAGHEIGLHGYTHEHPGELSTQQFQEVMDRSHKVLTDFCGKPPRGFTAPAWDPHPEQITILERMGLRYDHSYMHDDYHCYWAPKSGDQHTVTNYTKEPTEWMKPSTNDNEKSDIVVVPASWTFDDWPAFQFEPTRLNCSGYVDPRVVLHIWQESFRYCYENFDTFVFPMTIHPQISGKAHVMRLHETLIDWINDFEGVEWVTFETMAEEFRAGRI